ncbi:MAG: 4Fe-4S dicluster domain-containing protein [Magnetococcus sp. MYC-9]
MVDRPRRKFLRQLGGAALGVGGFLAASSAPGGQVADVLQEMLQKHYLRMSPEELQESLARIERAALREHGAAILCSHAPPLPGVSFGMALNLSRCVGARDCVRACVQENNCGRHDTLENIRVLSLPRGSWALAEADPYYNPPQVPEAGRWYLPVQCQQCDDPPCVQNCPVRATWKEPDGVVVIDYDWCIGCRACAVACPYGARHFNWQKPAIPHGEMTTETHYLGNRPRPMGVMEKCTFCIQRTRNGLQPACLEACRTGARIFGNLLDPASEIRHILATRPIYRFKEDLGSKPRFFYFVDAA